ncbi:MAG: GGDEF domain-containing protein [Xanthobacteraceae bacterium]
MDARSVSRVEPVMALQGPFAVVSDAPAPDLVEPLRAVGAHPIVETTWAAAPRTLTSLNPHAVILAEPGADKARCALAAALSEHRKKNDGLFMPVIARTRDDAAPAFPDALAIAANAPAERLLRRVSAALRVRTLHGTALRRMRTLVSRGAQLPGLPAAEPLDEASVLVAGRGRFYPDLCVAIGEHVGVVGALSVEGAARALAMRDVGGMVIGDGFGMRVVEALLTVLAEEPRFYDMPVAVLGNHPSIIEPFALALPNLDRVAEGPQRLAERFMPFVRMNAFALRLKRVLASLDAKGVIDPDTGLLAQDVFWRDLNRAVEDAEKRGASLSIARFSFDGADRRTSLDAARLVARLMRQVDFACQEADKSIFAVFTEMDLRAAHVVTRRIASVLKNTMAGADRKRSSIPAAVTLATLKPTDNVDSLVARVINQAAG